jgi:hypothetical protein
MAVPAGEDLRCSALARRTSDRGRLDPEERESRIAWENLLVGGKCVTQFERFLRLLEVNFSTSSVNNTAVSRGSSSFHSRIWRMQQDAHATSMIGAIPLYSGYQLYAEIPEYDLTELFGLQWQKELILGLSGYPGGGHSDRNADGGEAGCGALGGSAHRSGPEAASELGTVRPCEREATGGARTLSPGRGGDERPARCRLRVHGVDARTERLTGGGAARHLGWQQALGDLRWSLESCYKRIKGTPVPTWRAVPQFNTGLGRSREVRLTLDPRGQGRARARSRSRRVCFRSGVDIQFRGRCDIGRRASRRTSCWAPQPGREPRQSQ